MNQVNLNSLAAELYAAAVEKGFWDVEDAEIKHIAKMHSELSEAVQADRVGIMYNPEDSISGKPEGVAVELADFAMMVLDWAKQRGVEIVDFGEVTEYNDVPLCRLVNNMHEGVVLVDNDWVDMVNVHYGFMVRSVEGWLKARNIDLWQIIDLKMKINRDRPKLHGRAY